MEAWWSACEYDDKNSARHIRSSQVQTRALPNRQATIIQTKSYQTLSYVDSPASSTKQKMSVLFASRCYTCLSLFGIVFLLLVMRLSSSWPSISITASGHG